MEECNMLLYCRNSKMTTGIEAKAKCALCRLSPENIGRDMVHYWQPTDQAREEGISKHPVLVAEAANKRFHKRIAKLDAKKRRDPKKRKISRLAALAEKKTEKQIIHATKNSGRRNKDGDHVHADMITLDTKLQTMRENPVIFLKELEKVRDDSKRAGSLIGGLVIRNKNGVGCVVLKEEDYVELTRRLLYSSERNNEQLGSVLPIDGKIGSLKVKRP